MAENEEKWHIWVIVRQQWLINPSFKKHGRHVSTVIWNIEPCWRHPKTVDHSWNKLNWLKWRKLPYLGADTSPEGGYPLICLLAKMAVFGGDIEVRN